MNSTKSPGLFSSSARGGKQPIIWGKRVVRQRLAGNKTHPTGRFCQSKKSNKSFGAAYLTLICRSAPARRKLLIRLPGIPCDKCALINLQATPVRPRHPSFRTVCQNKNRCAKVHLWLEHPAVISFPHWEAYLFPDAPYRSDRHSIGHRTVDSEYILFYSK